MDKNVTGSWRIAARSIRANLIPMLILWVVAVVVIVSYNTLPIFASALEPLQRWQTSGGWLAAFANRAVFCGLLPGIIMAIVPSIRPRRPWLAILAQIAWLGVFGVFCNAMYSLNAWLFGTGTDIGTLVGKTLVSQFIWTPFVFAVPSSALCLWIACDFSRTRLVRDWPKHYLSRMYFPFLLSNWVVWIPVMMVVHAFPTPLQIQLSGLAGAFWSLLGLELGRRARQADIEQPK